MFTVIYVKPDEVRSSRSSWYINQQKPIFLGRIEGLIADGDELEFIKCEFDNIPMPANGKIVTWEGDFARFLYANIITPLK